MTSVLAGFVLGLAGSAHCAAMCGPVLLVLTRGAHSSARTARRAALVYHASRIAMYVLLAVPAGYAGRALAAEGLGRVLAILAGVVLLFAAAASGGHTWFRPVSRAWSAAVVRLGVRATALTRRYPLAGYAVLGMVNGLVPCGLVYAAATSAAAFGAVSASVLFMAGFGLGTVPALLGLTMAAVSIPLPLRRRLGFVGPAIMAIAGLLLIGRALLPPAPAGHHHALSSQLPASSSQLPASRFQLPASSWQLSASRPGKAN
jgi:sulfite exporter TauE/SafE